MTARLVTRHWAADEEMAKGTKPLVLVPVVTDSDAALLEAIVRAADHLALELQPYRLDSEVTKCACCGGEWITEQPDGYQNHQRLCAWALYDAARGKVKP